jgi:hypothetical protein
LTHRGHEFPFGHQDLVDKGLGFHLPKLLAATQGFNDDA